MTKAEAATFDPGTLRDKSMSQICDIVEELITIIRDQDETIQIQGSIIANLEDDGK